MNFSKLFESLSKAHVVVVGDVMLDTYWWGDVDRISPEAPVPIVSLKRKELRVGGASNVALNTASLGAKTSIVSVTGADEDAKLLLGLMSEAGIQTDYIVAAANRITTNKTRVMGRNQQMMRLDSEQTMDIDGDTELALLDQFKKCIESMPVDVVILEDYNKGILTPNIIRAIIALCKEKNIITAVDPKKKNFLEYKGVTLFKPNLKEIKEGLNISFSGADITTLSNVHQQLHAILRHSISFITLSEHGVYYNDGNNSKLIPTHVRNIADVSGAGDTVIAVASLIMAITGDMYLAAEMANIAGGLVCEEVGTAAINKEKLLQECKLLLTR